MNKFCCLLLFSTLLFHHHASAHGDIQKEVQSFLDQYTATYVELYALSAEAEWLANTLIIDGVDSIGRMTNLAGGAFSSFTGSIDVINKTRAFLKHKSELTPLQVKQLETILYNAANNAQTDPELVKTRIAAETAQTNKLFGYTFKIDGKEVSPNDIDAVLSESTDLKEREAYWNASKDVGKTLKPGLAELVQLRNKSVQNLDYKNYFEYQVSDYGMTSDEMMAMMRQFLSELWPLYRELHTFARYEMAKKYGVSDVPDMLPAHWLPNRWGQDWGNLVTVEGLDLDAVLKEKSAEWLVRQSESFYVSLGFPKLPESFYTMSSLYPAPKGTYYKKNTHASAWHMNLGEDVRSLMSVESNARWYETTHHELGHIYYYMAYTRDDVPPLLRGGANRGFHEAVGSLLGMASMQKPFIQGIGLIGDVETDEMKILLKEALEKVVFMPFSAGTMSHFEHDLYATNLPVDQYNKRWWEYAAKFQGMVPPSERGEVYCDAATKTHINNDAAQYYDYALSYIILHQLHDHIATKILKQNPRATNYYGNKEVGTFLNDILKQGATKDWRKVMRESLNEDISAASMLNYFKPLMGYLKKANKGRSYTLPEKPAF